MAQYFTDFRGIPHGGVPAGAERIWRLDGSAEFAVRPPAFFASQATSRRRALSLLDAGSADVKIKARWRILSFAADGFGELGPALCVRASGASSGSSVENGYVYGSDANGGRRASLFRFSGGVFTQLNPGVNALPAAIVRLDWYWSLLEITGTTVRAKIWKDSVSEPESWNVSETDANLTSGRAGIVYIGAGICEFAEVAISTHGDPFLTAYGEGVNGVITDDAGSPAARVVRAYRRNTGVLVAETTSDPVTGAYSFDDLPPEEIQVVVLDDAAGTLYNDLIMRVLPE